MNLYTMSTAHSVSSPEEHDCAAHFNPDTDMIGFDPFSSFNYWTCPECKLEWRLTDDGFIPSERQRRKRMREESKAANSLTAPIPVYASRFSEITSKPGYGAFIAWSPGEKCLQISKKSKEPRRVIHTDAELKLHDSAPIIDSARGRGKWVYEMILPDGSIGAVSAASLIIG